LFYKKIGIFLTCGGAVSGKIIAPNPSISGGIFLDFK